MRWMAWSLNADNGGGGGTAVWDRCRSLWKNAGIQDFPWMHVRSMADLQRLLSVGEAKDSPALGVNIEDVVDDKLSLQEVSGFLLDFWVNRYEKPVHMATLDWVQNGQGWQYMNFAVAALEFFPGEGSMPHGWNPIVAQQCIDHAQAEGLRKIAPILKTEGQTAQTYGKFFSICHSLYTADDIAPTAAAWNAWKSASTCVHIEEPDMSPLPPNAKKEFRDQLRRYCLVAQKYDSRWHYTQTRPYTGLGAPASDTHYNDCSSYVAIAYWKAGRNSGHAISDPLGYHYTGWGNTGSAYATLKNHPAPEDKYRIGDVALYLEASGPGDHMIVCIKAGDGETSDWSSFGTEAGPDLRKLHYRPDLTGVYRHSALL